VALKQAVRQNGQDGNVATSEWHHPPCSERY